MTSEHEAKIRAIPRENLNSGVVGVEIPKLGEPIKGKVRDIWTVGEGAFRRRVMVTTDRLSAFDKIICAIPGKGKVLNLLSSFWFNETKDIVANHLIDIPHPNVIIAREAVATLPVEVVLRRYMAESSSSTSVWYNYNNLGKNSVYGISFPDGLRANQELPMGTIITPTTKAERGHDQELTDEQARLEVDSMLGKGFWDRTKEAALALFERGREHCMRKGLILADTKYEFGIDENGNLMLIDELHTPDSSRFWLADTYQERFERGEAPQNFDKEIIRKWLSDHGFRGDGPIPVVDRMVIDKVAQAYAIPYRMLTGSELPDYPTSSPQAISNAVLSCFSK